MDYPLTTDAYADYIRPVCGVDLCRFLKMEFLSRLRDALGRQLTNDDRRIFVDFERDGDGELIKIKCHACGTGSVAVKWHVPTMKFIEHLSTTQNIEESLEAVRLPELGCFFMDPNDKMGQPLALCGPAFPGYVKRDERFQRSCLHDLYDQINGFGIPFSTIVKIQDATRLELKRKAEAEKAEQRKVQELLLAQTLTKQRQVEERAQAERARKNRINKLAGLVGFGA